MSRNIEPNRAKNTSVIGDAGGGEARVLEEAQVEHRVVDAALPADEGDEQDDGRRANAGDDRRVASSRAVGASMIAQTSATRPAIESTAPSGVERRGVGVAATRARAKQPATRATMTIGTLTRNTEPHQKCSSSQPPSDGPRATPRPATPAQIADGLRPAPRVGEDVGEDRQGGRHDQRAADAHDGPGGDQLVGGARPRRPQHEPTPKITRPSDQRAVAAEAVAEAAGGEQQAGEHERVGVDDPLQLAGRRRRRSVARRRAGRR